MTKVEFFYFGDDFMDDSLFELPQHVDEFNKRTQDVTNKVNEVFKLNLNVDTISEEPPKYFNSQYRRYLQSVQSKMVKSLTSLSNQLMQKNLIAPMVVIPGADWQDIDRLLKMIEDRINKY